MDPDATDAVHAGERSRREWWDTLPPTVRAATAWSGALLVMAGLGLLAVAFTVALRAAVVPALIALLITALLVPLDRRLRKAGLPPAAAAALTCVALVVIIDGALWMLVTLLTDAGSQIIDSLQDAADRASGDGPVAKAVRGAADGLSDLGHSAAGAVAEGVVSGVGLAAQLLMTGILTLALAFFQLKDRDRAVPALRRMVPGRHGDLLVRMARRAYEAMAGFMRGTTVVAAADAVFIAVGLTLLGVPNAFGLGALVFVGAYVPYVGAFLTGVVAVLVAFADGGLTLALGALAVVLAVQMIEGVVLQPVVQSRTVSLHPALVMLAVTAGASLGGLVGTLLAVPLTAAALGVIRELRQPPASGDRRP
ncbi:AI-2E family transporter [Streptomyces sp. NPDC006733]|uniref:AI-2E family transporter n=1 Tax=Streptomyces sp. NPDC006733 TaxID=3155460 RepID=UPI0033C18F17